VAVTVLVGVTVAVLVTVRVGVAVGVFVTSDVGVARVERVQSPVVPSHVAPRMTSTALGGQAPFDGGPHSRLY
jgi:hypothetical protein